ncbi:ABC transporter permease [Pseudoroseomonas wenyumeiae]
MASGLTLIFGVLGLVNFAHGTLYMMGAYFALSAYAVTESFVVATVAGALGVAALGFAMERTLFRRIYGADVLMQLLVCYAVILIMDDVVKIVWGGDFLKMDMPEAFRRPPMLIGGGIVPLFYLVLFIVTLVVAALLALGMSRTRFGRTIRAAAVNPTMVASLGVNTSMVFAVVFAVGAGLAGLAGALGPHPLRGAGRRRLDPDRELHRHRHRRHGLHRRRAGGGAADRPHPLLRLHWFPALHRGADVRDDGRHPAGEAQRPGREAHVMKLFSGWRGDVLIALGALVLTALLVLGLGSNGLVDFTIRFGIFGLLVLSLNLLIGTSGLVSFGHAAFFGSGAYAFGLLMQSGGWSVPAAILASLAGSALLALVIGALCVRLSEIYFAFLTLAFQMLIHSMIISWVSLTGGDQGLMGGVPKPPFLGIELARPQHLALFAAACLAVSAVLLRQVIRSPFGAALRMLRDNPQRAAFLGLSVFRYRLGAFVIAGTFAGLSGVLMSSTSPAPSRPSCTGPPRARRCS